MNIRRQTEKIEEQTLHPRACLSSRSRGRKTPERQGTLRTCFQHDRDRVIHSKAFNNDPIRVPGFTTIVRPVIQ